jgi:hypothetical protein
MNSSLRDSDVVCGRGGLAIKHHGNSMLRRICAENKDIYQSSTNPSHKHSLIASIIMSIEYYGGRFVKKTKNGWEEISEKKKKEKTSQLLREIDAPVRNGTSSNTKRRKFSKSQVQIHSNIQTVEQSKLPDVIPPERSAKLQEPVADDFAEFLMDLLPSEKEARYSKPAYSMRAEIDFLDLIPLEADEFAFENNKDYQDLCHRLVSVLSS